MNKQALKNLLLRMADDSLIIGHRNSEWTGIGPFLEEDLAFSSMAQDKIGHAQALYEIIYQQLENDRTPDQLAFMRNEKEMLCSHLVELPIGEYDFSLVRHFLFDHAEMIRYENLIESSFLPLSKLAKKVKGEIKYHIMHADTFMKQLANGNEESKARMQSALNYTFPFALGLFEAMDGDEDLMHEKIYGGEDLLKQNWLERITGLVQGFGLTMPDAKKANPLYGGRKGFHTDYLKPLLDEMCEVTRLDEKAEW